MARRSPGETGFVGQFDELDVGHGFFLSWRSGGTPDGGFGIGHRGDVDDRRYTVVMPAERETKDGDVIPMWFTYQPGEPPGPARGHHESLRGALIAAIRHLVPGFPESPAFDEVMVAILLRVHPQN